MRYLKVSGIVALLAVAVSCGQGAPPVTVRPAARLVTVQQVAALPSSQRAYLGQHTYLISRHSPYTLSVGTLMGQDMRPLTTLACTVRPAISFVFSGHLVLLCPLTGSLTGLLINASTGQETRLWTWRGQMNGASELTAWAGNSLFWNVVPNVLTGTALTGGNNLETGAHIAFPAGLGGVLFADNRTGSVYVMTGQRPSPATLWYWTDGQRIKLGTLRHGHVLAVGRGGLALAVGSQSGATSGNTVYLERAGSGVSRQWSVPGELLTAGMVYFVVWNPTTTFPAPGSITVDFPLAGRSFTIATIAQPLVANGDIYLRTDHGVERIQITGADSPNALMLNDWP